jgi:predicted nuclease with TOPRIM domain
MIFNCAYRSRFFFQMLLMLAAAVPCFAGVSRSIQEQYKKDYENKALFLKIPIYSEKQFITISGQSFRIEPGSGSTRYKVGDQLRVLLVEFAGDEIKLKMGGIAAVGAAEIIYKFDGSLQESFPNKDVFNRALQATLTEGLKYTEIDEAKHNFIEGQFERSVRETMGSTSMSRDVVLKKIASLVPAYQDAQRDIESLKNKAQDLSGQLSQSQSDNRKLGSESKAQQAELARLKSASAALQEKIDGFVSQVSKLSDELRDAKTAGQGYQKEIASLQSKLTLKADASQDLTRQIADLDKAKKQLQKEKDALGQQITGLQTSLEKQKAANAGLAGDNEQLNAANQRLKLTIDAISSKGDSLTKQYLNLQKEKEKRDEFLQSVGLLQTRITEETTEGGIYSGKANVFLGNILLGSLAWSIPINLNHSQSKKAEATFSAESINDVQMTAEEKAIRHSFGQRLKMRIDLASSSATMIVAPEQEKPLRDIGERDRSTWRWSISNQGAQDSQLRLTARLINRYSNEIPLFQQEHIVMASNAVRQVRNYLQPVPMAMGAVIGFLLFGIAGIFRRPKVPGIRPRSPAESSKPHSSVGPKQL